MEGNNEDLAFAQDTSVSGQLAQQWKLRVIAQEVALTEIGNSGLRRLLAFDESFTRKDVKIGDTALFY